ncbi:hypothetical protein Q3A90_15160 [Priestia megaterium]|uniref:hypothetical protein n=1 Tax=Priestia megaterium TaxID=1404 RepID=UPI002675E407|nr:hypothetical protein [Priestia megaterium]WKU21116.1 hypothetical protein Q3A90_15160 [Priestia megaterium]
MIQAELNGKVPSSLLNSEDLLTSSVIGAFRYLSTPAIIVSILQNSINLNYKNFKLSNSLIKQAQYYFWPSLKNSEPDVIILLENADGYFHLVCVEVKYNSGKSSYEDESVESIDRKNKERDQLARQFEDLHDSSVYSLFKITGEKIASTSLVYLTNDASFPYNDLEESCSFIKKHLNARSNLYWLSWKNFHNEIKKFQNIENNQDNLILTDTQRLLERKELFGFFGFNLNSNVRASAWKYKSNSLFSNWEELGDTNKLKWKYRRVKR